MSTITLSDLAAAGACAEACEAFELAFGSGTAVDIAAVAAHPECRPHWRGWLTASAPGLSLPERRELAEATACPGYWRGAAA